MSGATLLLITLLLPGALALLLFARTWRPFVERLAPFTSWPVLGAALLTYQQPLVAIPELLLGVHVAVDQIALLLVVTSVLIWTVVGYRLSRTGTSWFLGAALTAQTGSLGALVTVDAAGFYFFFSLMTVASYGLVAIDQRPGTRAAARLYLSLALIGEMLVLAALQIAAGSSVAGMAVAVLLILGFGVKLGMPPFHVALPVAYRVAPAVGGALLGSVLVNAAVVGLIRLLPLSDALPALAAFLMTIGLMAAFGGAALGVLQDELKPLLGYSTVSQMGILTVAFGVAAGSAHGFAALMPAIALFASHHALVKAALFLLSGSSKGSKRLRFILITLLSLALASAPLTGGALAKLWIEERAYGLAAPWNMAMHWLLPLTSTGTALLMVRFLTLAVLRPVTPHQDRGGLQAPAVLTLTAITFPLAAVAMLDASRLASALQPSYLWVGIWPLLAAGLLYLIATHLPRRNRRPPLVPPGDVLVPLAALLRHVMIAGPGRPGSRLRHRLNLGAIEALLLRTEGVEHAASRFASFGVLFLLLLAALLLTMLV